MKKIQGVVATIDEHGVVHLQLVTDSPGQSAETFTMTRHLAVSIIKQLVGALA